MNFSKDKPSAILLMAFLMFSCGCVSGQSTKKKASEAGFVHSKPFKEYLKNYDDKETMTYSEKRLFNLINEEAFLNCEQYEFYIVYLYKANGDTTFNVYVLHSRDGITVSSMKSFNHGFPVFNYKRGEAEPTAQFKINIGSKIIKKEEAAEIKDALDKALKNVHDHFPAYDIPTRTIYYYDGQEYHGLSDYKISIETMNEIDKLFKNSYLFK